jgi:hypothetical protein
MSLKYYLQNLGLENGSEQSKFLRNIILQNKQEKDIIFEFKEFILAQRELSYDTIEMINKSIMTQIGSEYLGLGGDDYFLKSNLYNQFIEKFPTAFGLKFFYADCCFLNNQTVEEIYPILKEGMLSDKGNIYYPSTDLFDLIRESKFNFEFDLLLLDKYYQPCDKLCFDEYIKDFKEFYKKEEEQKVLTSLVWKGEKNSH